MGKEFKILKIDHVAIAVNNLKESKNIFDLLGMNSTQEEFVSNENVNVVKIKAEDENHALELLEPSDDSSIINKFINKNGQGIHHIALEVDDIYNALDFLKSKSVKLVYDNPQKGADNSLIAFIHPSSTPGVLIELCQKS
mgnify:CR=1 FL=1